MSTLDTELRPCLDRDGWLVVTFANTGYLPYVKNLHARLRTLDFPWRLLLVGMDDTTVAESRASGMVAIRGQFPKVSNRFVTWGEPEYVTLMFLKLDMLAWLLTASSVRHLVYIDADLWVYHDFLPDLKQRDGVHPVDLAAPCDEASFTCGVDTPTWRDQANYWLGRRSVRCPNICGGVLSLNPTRAIKRFLDYRRCSHGKWAHLTSDQAYLNRWAPHAGVQITVLPRTRYPNGPLRHAPPLETLLLHYNYLIGDEKRNAMILNQHWLL